MQVKVCILAYSCSCAVCCCVSPSLAVADVSWSMKEQDSEERSDVRRRKERAESAERAARL